MEDSGTQCRDSRSRNWSEKSAESWQPSEFLSWKGSQTQTSDGDERVLPASADAAQDGAKSVSALLASSIEISSLAGLEDHYPFG